MWTGETIAAWRNQGYHEQAGYENVKQVTAHSLFTIRSLSASQLLEEPLTEVQQLTYGRMPVRTYYLLTIRSLLVGPGLPSDRNRSTQEPKQIFAGKAQPLHYTHEYRPS